MTSTVVPSRTRSVSAAANGQRADAVEPRRARRHERRSCPRRRGSGSGAWRGRARRCGRSTRSSRSRAPRPAPRCGRCPRGWPACRSRAASRRTAWRTPRRRPGPSAGEIIVTPWPWWGCTSRRPNPTRRAGRSGRRGRRRCAGCASTTRWTRRPRPTPPIVDLDLAERGADGLVHFDHDVVVVRARRPGEPATAGPWSTSRTGAGRRRRRSSRWTTPRPSPSRASRRSATATSWPRGGPWCSPAGSSTSTSLSCWACGRRSARQGRRGHPRAGELHVPGLVALDSACRWCCPATGCGPARGHGRALRGRRRAPRRHVDASASVATGSSGPDGFTPGCTYRCAYETSGARGRWVRAARPAGRRAVAARATRACRRRCCSACRSPGGSSASSSTTG